MGIEFAEKIIDSMVDENGHCGERGLSHKQFDCIARYLERGEDEDAGGWVGNMGGSIGFVSTDYEGDVGKYHVKLNEYWHFNRACSVVSIDPRPEEDVERERRLREIAKFEHSEWVHEPKERVEMELVLVRESGYERQCYSGHGYEWVYIHTFADADGNCVVWKSVNPVKTERWDDDELVEEVYAEVGDVVRMKATVKEHGEYRGVKQTVVNRPKILGIAA